MMDKKEDVVLIELTGVSKIYRSGDRECRALDNISTQIEKGRFTAITGKSGSGKTTLLNLMGLLDRPDEGHILVDTMILLYQALLVFVRRRRTLRLLGILGQGKWRLALWAGISELPEPLLAAILAVFGAKKVVQNKLPMDVRMVLRGGDLPESWFVPCFLLGILMIITFFTKSIRTSGDNTGDL